jgi:hypothetical protein
MELFPVIVYDHEHVCFTNNCITLKFLEFVCVRASVRACVLVFLPIYSLPAQQARFFVNVYLLLCALGSWYLKITSQKINTFKIISLSLLGRFSRLWIWKILHVVMWQRRNIVSEKTYCRLLHSAIARQEVSPKRWRLSIRLHGVTSQKRVCLYTIYVVWLLY